MKKFWEIKNEAGQDPELLLYGPIVSQKPWWDEGGDTIAPKQFADDLKALGTPQSIVCRVNSMGGDVFAAQAIYTALKSHSASITVIIEGIAGSAATIVCCAGDKVKAPSNAMMMFHNPLVTLWGDYNTADMEKMTSVLEVVKEGIINAYMAKTGRTREDLSTMMDQETWMTGAQAMSEGFVDEIMFEPILEPSPTNDGRFLVVNSIAHDMSKFKTRPNLGKPPVNTTPAAAVIPPVIATPAVATKQKESEKPLEIKDIKDTAELRQHLPELCNQIMAEAQSQERDRIKNIDDISATIDPKLVVKAKYEEPITAEVLAFQAIKADAAKGASYVATRTAEVAAAGTQGVEAATPETDAQAIEDASINRIAASANKKRKGDVK